jgi:hypothetical protein
MTLSPRAVNPKTAYFIKLGKGGAWERACIEQDQTLHVGWREVPLELCKEIGTPSGAEKIKKLIRTTITNEGAVTRDFNAFRIFCESGSDVLWVTFYAGRLWWCFSKPEITELPDKTKPRPVIGRWSDCDINNQPLHSSTLSGRLLSMQAFRGTICAVAEFNYLVSKINGTELPEVIAARCALSALEQRIETIIRALHWKDFEILVDLIFRQAGWQRMGVVGEILKTLDLDLVSPITRDRYGIQIKSQATLADFEAYQELFEEMKGYRLFYFVVHDPSADLAKATGTEEVKLWLPKDIAYLSVRYGLIDWILGKVG